jgi:ABC-type iron transport system FetAB ATPase subunit
MWHGTTVFHLTPDLNRQRVPYVLQFFKLIMVAASANMKLTGKVDYFALESSTSISMVVAQYGNEARHLGLEVKWMVKESVILAVGDPSLSA